MAMHNSTVYFSVTVCVYPSFSMDEVKLTLIVSIIASEAWSTIRVLFILKEWSICDFQLKSYRPFPPYLKTRLKQLRKCTNFY